MVMIWPASAMVLYIFAIGLATVFARVQSVRKGVVRAGYYKTFDPRDAQIPERLVVLGRHYNNQFELPLLFLITCAICIAIALDSALAHYAAWGFVAARVLHGFIHLGSNNVLKRMLAFVLGWVMLLVIWVAILKSL